MYIYITTNKINGKIYIGQTTKDDLNYLGSGKILLKAIKKYGKENFSKDILEYCDDKKQLNESEIGWIKKYNSTAREIGYNISDGGNGGNLGEKVNERLSKIAKKSNRMIGNTLRKGKTPWNKGKEMSEEQKEKLRKPKSEEHKRKLSKSKMGKGYKPIFCITNNKSYKSLKDAAEKLNLTVPNIVNVLKRRAEKTKGYSFIYIKVVDL